MRAFSKRIHSAAPVRICDIGGWTDTWFSIHGAVLNIAVSPYVEVQLIASPRESDERVTLNLENFQESYSLNPDEIEYDQHPLIEATIDSVEIPEEFSLDINIFSNIPSGAAVGTSAAVCVALFGALNALTPGEPSPRDAAASAHIIETEKLKLQAGIQDQICCAYGGINLIQMDSYPHSIVSTIDIEKSVLFELENRLLLVYIGAPHSSSELHERVIAHLGNHAEKDERLKGLRELPFKAKRALSVGDLDTFAQIMSQNTDLQRQLHPDLVCDKFDEVINIARSFGAEGFKVNGAGGDGGSITILGDGDSVKKREMVQILQRKGFQVIPIALSRRGLHTWGVDQQYWS